MNKASRSSPGVVLSFVLCAIVLYGIPTSGLFDAAAHGGPGVAAAGRNKTGSRRPSALGARNRFEPLAGKLSQPGLRRSHTSWPLFNGAFERLSGPGRRAVLVSSGIIKAPPKTIGPERHKGKVAPEQISAGDNIRVNDPTMDTNGHTQSETSIAVNGRFIVETFNDSDFEDVSGYSYSSDGGSTFTHARMPLKLGGLNLGDGTVALGPSGEFYYSEIAFDTGSSFFNVIVGVTKSTDNGVTFSAPLDASTTASNESDFQDKPWITADRGASSPFRGNVYVSWTDFTATNGSYINVARSVDGAASFQSPVTVSPKTGKYTVQGSIPAVAPNGDLYVAYVDTGNPASASMSIVKSTDGGQTFSSPISAATLNAVNPVTGGDSVRDNSFPSMVVDKNGAVHITYDAEPVINGPDRSDVYYIRSSDGGHSFTPPARLNDDGTTTTQLFPSITAAADGTLAVKWWDRRNDPGDDSLTDVYMTMSSDGGNSFSKNFRITNHNWVFGPVEAGFAASYHGDYDGITSDGGNFYLSWSDERSGDADAFFTFIPESQSPAAGDYNISAAKLYDSLVAGNSTQFQLNTGAVNGFTATLALSAAPSIPGVTYSFTSATVGAGSPASLNVSTDPSTHSGTYLVTITAATGTSVRRTNVKLSVENPNRTTQPPVDISNTRGFTSLQSGLRVDQAGTVHLVYDDDSAVGAGGSQVFYSKSSDGGRTYSAPAVISGNSADSIEPTLAVDAAGNLYATWLDLDPVKGTARVMVSSSSDRGASFSAAVGVSPASDQAETPTIAVDKSGNIICAYIDIKSIQGLVFAARSTDGGKTFSNPGQVSGSREDASTSGLQVVFDSRGAAYLVYNDQQASIPTINLAIAGDGRQFSTATVISDPEVSTFSPAIAIDNADNIYVAFTDFFLDLVQGENAEIVVSRSCDHGATFSAAVDVSNNAGESLFPSINTDGGGNIAVAWEDTDNNLQADIFVARSVDGGATFELPINVSANPGFSVGPAAVFDNSGALVVAWTDDSSANPEILTASIGGLGGGSPDFELIPYPKQVSISGGEKGEFTVLIGRTGRFAGNVSVAAADTSAFKLSLKPNSEASSCTSVSFSFKAAKSAPVGTYHVVFSGRDDSGRVRTAIQNLVIK